MYKKKPYCLLLIFAFIVAGMFTHSSYRCSMFIESLTLDEVNDFMVYNGGDRQQSLNNKQTIDFIRIDLSSSFKNLLLYVEMSPNDVRETNPLTALNKDFKDLLFILIK